MPLYEYRCDACGHTFETIQRFSDPPVETCPSCGHGPVQKLLSPPAIHFKGSGWYVTDYAKKGAAAEASPASGSNNGSGGATKTPAAAAEAGKSPGATNGGSTAKPAAGSKD